MPQSQQVHRLLHLRLIMTVEIVPRMSEIMLIINST
jgi:hypothetical protein